MEMEREINSLSDGELDAVVGGMMHNGQINELVLKNPQAGVPGTVTHHALGLSFAIYEAIAIGALAGIVFGNSSPK
jgi:hypothetical protein